MKLKQTLVLGLLFVVMFIVPTFTKAQSVCDLNLMICNLNGQILSLQLSSLQQQVANLSQPCGQPNAVYDFLTGQRCSTSQPSVKVLSPTKGQTYNVGDQITVRWSSSSVPSVINATLHRRSDSTVGIRIGEVGMVNDGTEVWEIPMKTPPANDYFVRVNLDVKEPETGQDVVAESGTFIITDLTSNGQLPILELISSDTEVQNEPGQSDTAKGTVVFEARAVGGSLFPPDHGDVRVYAQKSDGSLVAVSSKQVSYTPYTALVPEGSKYRIEVNAVFSPSVSGVYRFVITQIDWSYLGNPYPINITQTSGLGDLKTDLISLYGNGTQLSPTITSTEVPNGAIIAQKETGSGFRYLKLNFSSAVPTNHELTSPNYYSINSSNSSSPISVLRLSPWNSDRTSATIEFTRALAYGERITVSGFTGKISCVGYLPGDVDGSGMVAPADQLALIDVINGVKILPSYATDIDRSGATNAADIIALVDGFNSGWLGKTLPACPAGSVGIVPTGDQLSGMASAISALSQAIQAFGLSVGH